MLTSFDDADSQCGVPFRRVIGHGGAHNAAADDHHIIFALRPAALTGHSYAPHGRHSAG